MQHCKFRGLTEEFVLAMQSCAWARLRGAVVELGESSLDLVTDHLFALFVFRHLRILHLILILIVLCIPGTWEWD